MRARGKPEDAEKDLGAVAERGGFGVSAGAAAARGPAGAGPERRDGEGFRYEGEKVVMEDGAKLSYR